jgi:hypothetical protein
VFVKEWDGFELELLENYVRIQDDKFKKFFVLASAPNISSTFLRNFIPFL